MTALGRAARALFVIIFALSVVATVLCGWDGVKAHTDQAPEFLFCLVLPYLQTQYIGGGRFISLAASLALPALSLALPLVSIVWGLVIRQRSPAERGTWQRAASIIVVVAVGCLCASAYSCYAVYRAYCAVGIGLSP